MMACRRHGRCVCLRLEILVVGILLGRSDVEGEVVIQRQFAFLLQRLEHIQIMVYHALVGSAAWHEAVESQLGIPLLDTYSVSGGWGELCEEHGVHSASHIDDDVIVGAMHDVILMTNIFIVVTCFVFAICLQR